MQKYNIFLTLPTLLSHNNKKPKRKFQASLYAIFPIAEAHPITHMVAAYIHLRFSRISASAEMRYRRWTATKSDL